VSQYLRVSKQHSNSKKAQGKVIASEDDTIFSIPRPQCIQSSHRHLDHTNFPGFSNQSQKALYHLTSKNPSDCTVDDNTVHLSGKTSKLSYLSVKIKPELNDRSSIRP